MFRCLVRKTFIALSLSAMAAVAVFAPAQAENLKGNAVVLRTLDKVTATTKDYTVKIGDELTYGSLTVAVKHCEKKPPEDVPETFAFLQIDDLKQDGKGDISALDHSVYDIWVIDCKVPAVQGLR